MRTMLSDKSVCYSETFASLLDLTLQNSNKEDVATIDQQLTADYEAKCRSYQARIAELEKALQDKKETTDVAPAQTEDVA
jgi:uncharacterized protein YeeX (DUF496 family)